MIKKYKAVLFDLDDTLYSEIDYIYSGFNVVSKYMEPILNTDSNVIKNELIDLFAEDKNRVFDEYLIKKNLYNNVMLQKCIELYQNHIPEISLDEETKQVLLWLKNEDYKLGMITDGRPVGQNNKIISLNIMEFFDSIIITDELGGIKYRKPDEYSYIKIMENLGVNVEECIYIGDNIYKDFIATNKLGMKSVQIINKKGLYRSCNYSSLNSPTHIINSIIDLIGIISIDKET